MGALATLGPLAVVVDASSWSFYAAGIARPNSWATVDLDHGVQLVGYGTQDGMVSPARCEPCPILQHLLSFRGSMPDICRTLPTL